VRDPGRIVVGRSRECDLVVANPSVSGRHAQLLVDRGVLLVEDLGSANGTFLDGRPVAGREPVAPGQRLQLGDALVPWDHPVLARLVRASDQSSLAEGTTLPGRRFICGACGTRGVMPPGFVGGPLRCGACRTRLVVGPPRRSWWGLAVASAAVAGMLALAVVGWGLFRQHRSGTGGTPDLLGALGPVLPVGSDPRPARTGAGELVGAPPATPEEASIRAHTVHRVVQALQPTHPATRNAAVRIAADEAGVYGVEQVARLFTHVRERWRYVNDPAGVDYFASASETLDNGLAGDCDDFAILLVSMVTSIGGRARLVMMDGPHGGHAYAEACLEVSPEEVAARLARFVRRLPPESWQGRLRDIHFRSSADCPVWLNLDWNARNPGGPYEPETWAVAIHADGHTETLAPSRSAKDAGDREPGSGVTATNRSGPAPNLPLR